MYPEYWYPRTALHGILTQGSREWYLHGSYIFLQELRYYYVESNLYVGYSVVAHETTTLGLTAIHYLPQVN
jgi:hypothetical protein